MKKLRILFITPAATRTGAPMLMLHLIRYLKARGEHEIAMVLQSSGAMATELSEGVRSVTFNRAQTMRWTQRLLRLPRRVPWFAAKVRAANAARCRTILKNWSPDLVYCNSASTADELDALGPFNCPVVCNVHELENVFRILNWPAGSGIELLRPHVTHYLAGSEAVRQNLIDRHGVRRDQTSVVHDFIDTSEFAPAAAMTVANRDALAKLGIPDGAKVVGAMAVMEWRKGTDLLVPLARLVPQGDAQGRPIHLVWVGGGAPEEVARLKSDIEIAGLGGRVHLAGSTSRTADWYPVFTALALLSREDPFPLVALEAAASGVPTICFAGGGGMPEFVESDAGFVVPYLDLRAYAKAIETICGDDALRARLGEIANRKVRGRHDVTVAVPQILTTLQQLVGKASA